MAGFRWYRKHVQSHRFDRSKLLAVKLLRFPLTAGLLDTSTDRLELEGVEGLRLLQCAMWYHLFL